MGLDLEALARARATTEIKKEMVDLDVDSPITARKPAEVDYAFPCALGKCEQWSSGEAIVDGVIVATMLCADHAHLGARQDFAFDGPEHDPRDPARRVAPGYAKAHRVEELQAVVDTRSDLLPPEPGAAAPTFERDMRRAWIPLRLGARHVEITSKPSPRRLGDPRGF